jgi:NDP-sugar pyrophosphorylase family protein
MANIEHLLREFTDDDRNFILNSFLQSYVNHSNYSYVAKSIYYKNQAKIIEFLLETASCLIICFPEAPDEIMGYIIYEYVANSLVIHWLYIKTLHRYHRLSENIIDKLLPSPSAVIIATHIPNYFGKLKEKSKYHMIYDPYYITNKRLLHN